MIRTKKKFNFSPKTVSSNKNKKTLRIVLDNSSCNSKERIKLNLFNKNNDFNNSNINKGEDESEIKYLITENEKEKIDFISTLLKLKGIQPHPKNNLNKNKYNNIKFVKKSEKTSKELSKDKKYNKKNTSKKEIRKIYNNKTMNSRNNNCIKEVTIDLMNIKSKDSFKKNYNKKEKKVKKTSFDKKIIKNDLKINRIKSAQKSPNKKIKTKIFETYKNQNYKKVIENKKKQLLEGKPLNLNVQKKYDKFIKMPKNSIRNVHTEKSKKIKFHPIEELEEYNAIKLNIKSYKINQENMKQKNFEKIEKYINNDTDDNPEEEKNKYTITTIKNNNSVFSSETLNNDLAILDQKNITSLLSTNTLNNDIVNYESLSKRSLYNNNNNLSNNNNNNLNNNNINNSSNTNFSIITNSLLNNDNNKNEENIHFLIENNSNIGINNLEQNNISDTILSDNKGQFRQKINVNEENKNNNLDSFSKDEESILEQFYIFINFLFVKKI